MPAPRHLKGREVRTLVREFTERYPAASSILEDAINVEELNVEGNSIFLADGKPLLLRTQGLLLPSLKFTQLIDTLPKIVVDMGAVPHIVNGAHVMRPGIKQIKSEFEKGDLVVIQDEKFGKALALGIADMDSNNIRSETKGKVIATVHYVGDEIWKAFPAKTP